MDPRCAPHGSPMGNPMRNPWGAHGEPICGVSPWGPNGDPMGSHGQQPQPPLKCIGHAAVLKKAMLPYFWRPCCLTFESHVAIRMSAMLPHYWRPCCHIIKRPCCHTDVGHAATLFQEDSTAKFRISKYEGPYNTYETTNIKTNPKPFMRFVSHLLILCSHVFHMVHIFVCLHMFLVFA